MTRGATCKTSSKTIMTGNHTADPPPVKGVFLLRTEKTPILEKVRSPAGPLPAPPHADQAKFLRGSEQRAKLQHGSDTAVRTRLLLLLRRSQMLMPYVRDAIGLHWLAVRRDGSCGVPQLLVTGISIAGSMLAMKWGMAWIDPNNDAKQKVIFA